MIRSMIVFAFILMTSSLSWAQDGAWVACANQAKSICESGGGEIQIYICEFWTPEGEACAECVNEDDPEEQFIQGCGGPGTATLPRNSRPKSCTQEANNCSTVDEATGNFFESIEIPGSGVSLNYPSNLTSSRVEDSRISYRIFDETPTFLTTVGITIEIAGRTISWTQPTTNHYVEWTWDGLDQSGQPAQAPQQANVSLNLGGEIVTASFPMGNANTDRLEIGGWSPRTVHHYSPNTRTLSFGDGRTEQIDSFPIGSSHYGVLAPGSRRVFKFLNSNNRHVETLSALTGAVLETMSYDSFGRLTSVTDAFGKVTSFLRNSSGTLTGIQSPDGLVTTVSMSGNRLSSVTTPGGRSFTMTYDTNGMLSTMQRPGGQTATYSLDSSGNLIGDSHSGGAFISYVSSIIENVRESVRTTAAGRSSTTKTEFSDDYYGFEHTSPRGVVTTTVEQFTGPRGISVTRDDTETQTAFGNDPRFGAAGKVVASKTVTSGSKVNSTTFTRGVSLTTPSNPFSIDRLWTKTTENGRDSYSVYRGASKTWYNTSAQGRTQSLEIDDYERPLCLRSGSRHEIRYAYHNDGKLWKAQQGGRVTEYFYNTEGFVSEVKNPLGQSTLFGYDGDGRLTSVTNPASEVLQISYNPNGKVTSITPAGKPSHGFFYNTLETLQSYLPPVLGGTPKPTEYVYNLDREVTRVDRPDGSQVFYNRHSTTGELQTITAGSSTLYSYTYHPNKELLASATADSLWKNEFAYDGFLKTSDTFSNASTLAQISKVDFGYDSNFWVTSMSVQGAAASSVSTLNYTYDLDGLVTAAGAASYRYSPLEPLLMQITLGDVKEGFSYTLFGELKEQKAHFLTTDLLQQSYTYDALGRVITKTEVKSSGTESFEYTYDLAGRLVEVEKNGSPYSEYIYDSNGNRTGGNVAGAPTTATYDNQDRILSWNHLSFTHNHNGERITKTDTSTSDTTTYAYDEMGLLTSVTLPNSDVIEYIYDGLGRRVGRIKNSSLTDQFVYSDQLQIIADLDPTTGEVRTRYVYASQSHSPDFMIRAGTTYRILKDRLGSVRLVVRTSDGVIAQEIEYDEFGRRLSDTNPGFQPFGFAGGLTDLETGLVRFGARDYDPITGRWTTKDPILFDGGDANLYGYVLSDPVNSIDPLGLYQICTRPVNGLPMFDHSYIRFPEGDTISWGPEGNPLGGPGKNNANDSGGTCGPNQDSTPEQDQRMRDWAKQNERNRYWPIGNNCHNFVRDAINAGR